MKSELKKVTDAMFDVIAGLKRGNVSPESASCICQAAQIVIYASAAERQEQYAADTSDYRALFDGVTKQLTAITKAVERVGIK